MRNLLEIDNLKTSFFTREGEVQAVRGVTFSVQRGEVVGIVGESGCGKSVTCKSVISLLGSHGKVVGGHIRFQGEDLARKTAEQMRHLRGSEIAMIFQDPMTALNPVLTIGAADERDPYSPPAFKQEGGERKGYRDAWTGRHQPAGETL
ncbi:Glutathione import ATP-binding protein GsiA [Cedecea neteri]|uniref:ABC-type dipeptide transporter n=1 Tax=Cedecea neteri TaxID=158822 RepID=A0A2X3J4I9_9ENTR|nr:Glutathione import ATP-binding protein GsiA [Cedecea neteri]